MSLEDTIRAAGARKPLSAPDAQTLTEGKPAAAKADGATAVATKTEDGREASADSPAKTKDEGVDVSAAVVQARSDERTRIKAILNAPGARVAADLACHIAFETDQTAEAAAALLAHAAPSTRSASFEQRMAEDGDVDLGTGALAATPKTPDDMLIAHARATARSA